MRCRTVLCGLAAALPFTLLGCADKDPVSSSSFESSPAARAISAPVASTCDKPGCRPGFGGGSGQFRPPPATPPDDQTIPHIASNNLPKIDANLSDWKNLFSSAQLQQEDFSSAAGELFGAVPETDQKVEAWLGWNEDTGMIYVAARVFDDVQATNSTPEDLSVVWRSDDFEVYIDGDNSGGTYSTDNGTAQQYVLNYVQGEVRMFLGGTEAGAGTGVLSAVSAEAVPGGVEYSYEISFPAYDLIDIAGAGTVSSLTPGGTVGLSIAFADFDSQEDADATAYHAFNSLNGNSGASANADAFTDFQLGAP